MSISASTAIRIMLSNQKDWPVEPMQIFVRRDLNMRKGKMAAQVAHAACAQLLNAMEDYGDYRVLSKPDFLNLLKLIEHQAVDIQIVADEATLRASLKNPEQSSIIIDRGLTEFGGAQTLTTAAQGVFAPSLKKATPLQGADLVARQWFVFSKQKPLPKELAAKMAAIGCLMMLEHLLTRLEGSSEGEMGLSLSDPALRGWLTAGFGKIGMGIKTDADLETLKGKLEGEGVHYIEVASAESKLLVIGPAFPERMATLTGQESDIYSTGVLTLL